MSRSARKLWKANPPRAVGDGTERICPQKRRIGKARASERVAERLAWLIHAGKLKPGDRLPSEHELMKQLGVGRSSVREAIRGLAMAGVLEATPRRGTVVISDMVDTLTDRVAESVTYWAMKDLYEVRSLLECHAAAMAARLATPEQVTAIEQAEVDMEHCIRAGKSHFAANSRFHLNICRASQNNALVFCLASIIDSFRETREHINKLESVPDDDIRDHRQILDAIKTRNTTRARNLMRAHLTRTIGRLAAPETD